MSELPLWDEVDYIEPLNGDPAYWATFDLGSVIGVKATRYVRGDIVHALRAQLLAARAEHFEEAAKLCDGEATHGHDPDCDCVYCAAAHNFAEIIRAAKGASHA